MNEIIEPLGSRILVRKDDDRQTTKGGILLPGKSEIPTITGRVVGISTEMDNDTDFPVREYDRVIFYPRSAIPVDLEDGNKLYIVPVDDVVAVFRKAILRVKEQAT